MHSFEVNRSWHASSLNVELSVKAKKQCRVWISQFSFMLCVHYFIGIRVYHLCPFRYIHFNFACRFLWIHTQKNLPVHLSFYDSFLSIILWNIRLWISPLSRFSLMPLSRAGSNSKIRNQKSRIRYQKYEKPYPAFRPVFTFWLLPLLCR